MTCWSCERAAGDGVTCAFCGAIQPADAGANYFQVLGVPARFALDVAGADGKFRELSRVVHPDRFATADPRARRFSTQRTVRLNEAWRALKDPIRRAEYLLSLAGFEIGAETGASRPGAQEREGRQDREGRTREKMPVPATLLGEILDLREQLSDARAAGDAAHVQKLGGDVRRRMEAVLDRIGAGFTRAEGEIKGSTDELRALEIVAHDLIEIRYLRRFLDEVEAHDEARLEESPLA